jgi:hypothetical protein
MTFRLNRTKTSTPKRNIQVERGSYLPKRSNYETIQDLIFGKPQEILELEELYYELEA